jgi:N-acetylglucosaminyldiphosphoundecaprenol N-acetyl-beta-D-mannosaminyltransferase
MDPAASPDPRPPRIPVLGLGICPVTLDQAASQVAEWARAGQHRTVFAAGVDLVMEAHDDPAFAGTVNGGDLVVPDGLPLVWALRLQDRRDQARIHGPGLMLAVCALAEARGLPVGLHGARPEVLERLVDRLRDRFPRLQVVYAWSPPSRTLDPATEGAVARAIAASGARILFVGLGCPRQETWMARQRDRIPAVQLGVGRAFEVHAGTLAQAPGWMGWCGRLAREPRRIWRGCLRHTPRFVFLLARQLARGRCPAAPPGGPD